MELTLDPLPQSENMFVLLLRLKRPEYDLKAMWCSGPGLMDREDGSSTIMIRERFSFGAIHFKFPSLLRQFSEILDNLSKVSLVKELLMLWSAESLVELYSLKLIIVPQPCLAKQLDQVSQLDMLFSCLRVIGHQWFQHLRTNLLDVESPPSLVACRLILLRSASLPRFGLARSFHLLRK